MGGSSKVDSVDPASLNGRLDRAYQDTLKRLPDPPAKNDPWGSVRASEQKPKDDKNKQAVGTK